jgi:hypothetical protein
VNRAERRKLARDTQRPEDRKAFERALKEAEERQRQHQDAAPRIKDLGEGIGLTESGLIVPSDVGKARPTGLIVP